MIRIRLTKSLLSAQGPMVLNVDLSLVSGAFVAVTGPSGGGKTTLLRLIAGLVRPESGQIRFGEECWLDTERKIRMSPQQRRVGMVFQDYALFPNMTVRENLAYSLERGQSQEIVRELIDIMEIQELVERYPATLSGGQQQRVALARALVRRPNLLLLDEPLSALDIEMRAKLQDYVLRVHDRFQLTTLLVSHSREEIRKMADRVIRLEQGRIVFDGKPAQMLENTPRMRGVVAGVRQKKGDRYVLIRIGDQELELPLSVLAGLEPFPGREVELWLDGVHVVHK